MPTQYDPDILQQYAEQLYREAKWVVFMTAARYAFVPLILTLGASLAANPRAPLNLWGAPIEVLGWGLTIISFLAGIDAGRRKAFRLKLQAQQILCDRQIELNTRARETSASAAQA